MVPLYAPATAAEGMLTTMVGFHAAVLFPTKTEPENAVRDVLKACLFVVKSWPGVKVPVPLVEVAAPDQ